MLLRTKIFRHLLVFALVPSLVIAAVSLYLQSHIVAPADRYIASFSPDRTINALRLAEARLQDAARTALEQADPGRLQSTAKGLDWLVLVDSTQATAVKMPPDNAVPIDSVLGPEPFASSTIRRAVGKNLFLGAWVDSNGRKIAGGFVLDHQYLDGFETATVSLSQGRFYSNLRPAFTLFSAATGAAVLVIVIVLAWLLSRRLSASVTNPLEQLTALTATVAKGEHPNALTPAGTDEISRLTERFQTMVRDLEENRNRLVAAERVAAWQEFARRLAHELKNPLTPLALSVYRIRKKLQEREDYQRYADSIEALDAEVSHLQRLADDYSSLARLPEPKFTRFRFDRLVREVIELHAPQLEAFHFDNETGEEAIEIQGDPDRLREVMVNLIKNALEFALPGGRIVIRTSRKENIVRFAVADENRDSGMAPTDLLRAKMPYVTTRPGGMGLGLAISEKIIIDHGGILKLEIAGAFTEASFEIPVDGPPQGVAS
ncbi:MAG: ATP-binding protein [candidate division Zixibacteria bacterium]|nr:ATP-binding protein [candidate division Zixibacteria bacterium]